MALARDMILVGGFANAVVRRIHSRLAEEYQRYVALREFNSRGVEIDCRVQLFAASAIFVERGCRIWGDTILSAGSLTNRRVRAKPRGALWIGEHCLIAHGVIMAAYGGTITLGKNVSINPYCVVYGHGDLTIGDNTRIAAGTVIIPANHVFADLHRPIKDQGTTCKGIEIGRDVWIGAGSHILDGVTIGDGAVVGAGSVATRSVGSGSVVAGAPARPIGARGSQHGFAKRYSEEEAPPE